MNDYLVRAISKTGNVRGMACVTTKLVNTICRQHATSPTASVALGRALSGGALMGALLKGQERVVLKFEGNGPLRKIIVEANPRGDVRGYVGNPDAELPLKDETIDVAGAIGHAGFLTVSKDLGLKEPYKGVVQLYSSEIAEDLAFYLAESEQIPSAVGLGVFVNPDGSIAAAGGFLVQSLPPADDALIDQVIARIEQMPSVTDCFRDGQRPDDLLKLIFADIPYDILRKNNLRFRCSCSKKRMEQALLALGAEELRTLLHEQEQTDVVCEFCRTQYPFGQAELQQLLQEIN